MRIRLAENLLSRPNATGLSYSIVQLETKKDRAQILQKQNHKSKAHKLEMPLHVDSAREGAPHPSTHRLQSQIRNGFYGPFLILYEAGGYIHMKSNESIASAADYWKTGRPIICLRRDWKFSSICTFDKTSQTQHDSKARLEKMDSLGLQKEIKPQRIRF